MRYFSIIMALVALMAVGQVQAQQTFTPAGGDMEGDGSFSFTIGQVSTLSVAEPATTVVTSTASLREGVQQTYTVEELSIEGTQPLPFKVAIYPNPTAENVTISLARSESGLRYELYNFEGQRIDQGAINEREQTVEMASLASGAYVLRIVGNGKENSYKIIKIR